MLAQALPKYKLKIQLSNDELKELDVTPYLEKGILLS